MAAAAAVSAPSEISVAYRVTTAEYLQRVEVFLTGFQTDARGGRAAQNSSGSRDLLATTRLLLDSPVANDVMLQTLLEDIELVLAQITSYSDRSQSGELDLIENSIQQRSVLFRLHSTVDVQQAGMPIQGVL